MTDVPPSTIRVDQSVIDWYHAHIERRYDEWDLWYQWYTRAGRRPRVQADQAISEQGLVVMASYLGIERIEVIKLPEPFDRQTAASRIVGTFDQLRTYGTPADDTQDIAASDGTDRLEGGSGSRVELRDLKSAKKRSSRGRSGRR